MSVNYRLSSYQEFLITSLLVGSLIFLLNFVVTVYGFLFSSSSLVFGFNWSLFYQIHALLGLGVLSLPYVIGGFISVKLNNDMS